MPPKRKKTLTDPILKAKLTKPKRKAAEKKPPPTSSPSLSESSKSEEDIPAFFFIPIVGDMENGLLAIDPENAAISESGRKHKVNKLDKLNESCVKARLKTAQKELDEYNKIHFSDQYLCMSIKDQILLSQCDLPTKSMVLKKLEDNEKNKNGFDQAKFMNWIKDVLRLPFSRTKPLPIDLTHGPEKIHTYLQNVKMQLDKAVAGHGNAKEEIIDFIARIISNPQGKGNILALAGPKGSGKTRLVRKGIAEALQRPFHVINLGGMNDVHVLSGHDVTYTGAKYGRLAQILIQAQCENPVIYLDELDKIQSGSDKGMEIFRLLTHILDEEQNTEFHDEYFGSVQIDLSKVLFVASLNNIDDVEPVLRDRLKIIHVRALDVVTKIKIVREYTLPELCKMVSMDPTILDLTDDVIRYIINVKCPQEDGCRQLKKKMETIIQKLNTMRITNTGCFTDVNVKIELSTYMVDTLLKYSDENPTENYAQMYN